MLGVLTMSAFTNESEYKIKWGEFDLELNLPVIMQDDRIYVSIRSLSEALNIPIEWNEDTGEVHLDVYNKQILVDNPDNYKEDGVIPDAETAYAVGKIILETYLGKEMEYETDERIYYLEVSKSYFGNVWVVQQRFDYKDGRLWVASGCKPYGVALNASTGEVVQIFTESTLP